MLIETTTPLVRLSEAEEKALNILLEKYGGRAPTGMPWYRLEWAPETNARVKVPVCFHAVPTSYHLLGYEMPSPGLERLSAALGEDTSKGTYVCLTHFVDRDGRPFRPTASIIELVIPLLVAASELTRAAAAGDLAVVERMRRQRIAAVHEQERKTEQKAIEKGVEILESSLPVFLNPYSGPAGKTRQFADLLASDLEKGVRIHGNSD